MRGTGDSECGPAVTSRTFVGDTKTAGTGGAVKKLSNAGRVYGNEAVNVLLLRREQVFSSAQVSVAFFSYASDKEQIALGLDIEFLKGAQHF